MATVDSIGGWWWMLIQKSGAYSCWVRRLISCIRMSDHSRYYVREIILCATNCVAFCNRFSFRKSSTFRTSGIRILSFAFTETFIRFENLSVVRSYVCGSVADWATDYICENSYRFVAPLLCGKRTNSGLNFRRLSRISYYIVIMIELHSSQQHSGEIGLAICGNCHRLGMAKWYRF